MSSEHMARLSEAAASDPTIAERMSGATTIGEAVRIAKDLGYTVTAEDFDVAGGESDELSEAELEHASGGTIYTTWTIPPRC